MMERFIVQKTGTTVKIACLEYDLETHVQGQVDLYMKRSDKTIQARSTCAKNETFFSNMHQFLNAVWTVF